MNAHEKEAYNIVVNIFYISYFIIYILSKIGSSIQ